MKAIEIKNLNKKYKDFELKDINFDVEKGTVMGLIGANGSGKTTILKSILSIIKYDGDIRILGEEISREIKDKVSSVFEEYFIGEYLSSKEVEKIYSDIYSKWDSNYFHELLEKLDIPKNKKYKDFSKGMKIKLKIAIALSSRPKLLILDEPTSGLDPVIRSEILDIFLEYMEGEDNSILISSHITTDLEKIADYITFIDDGQVIFSKEKYDLEENYGIVRVSEEDFEKIDKSLIKKFKKEKYQINVLVDDVEKFRKNYPNFVVDRSTIDEIMVLYLRGDKAWCHF